MRRAAILETVLYASDLDAARDFYERILGFELYSLHPGRQLFFKLAGQMLLIFNPEATRQPPKSAGLPVPPHGATGPSHVCFAASAAEIDAWAAHLGHHRIPIEADFLWPSSDEAKRGRSIYCRDPAGNSIEFAEPRIWGL